MDADGCPYSGSANILSASGNPSACVNVTPGGSYNFGGWFRNLDGMLYNCYVATYTGADCTGTSGTGINFTGTETAWTYRAGPIPTSSSVMSMQVRCDANANTYVDKLFLSTGGY
jgi:hypothetical protein